MNETINGKAICMNIFYNKDSFTIAVFKLEESGLNITLKGNYFVKVGGTYVIEGTLDKSNPKYRDTYLATNVKHNIDLHNCSDKELQGFLETIVTKRLAKNIIETIDKPIEAIENQNFNELLKVEGLGEKRIDDLIDGFLAQKDISSAIVYFQKYNLSNVYVRKIVKHFKSPDKAINEIERDPYALTRVPGIGFKVADSAFLYMCRETGASIHDIRRTKAYIDYLFLEEYNKGNTWLNSKQFVQNISENLKGVDVMEAINLINESELFYTVTNDNPKYGEVGKRITSKRNLLLEMEIAYRLREMAIRDSKLELSNAELIIRKTEESQGWEYSDEQKSAIQNMIDRNILLVQGKAGTGKSSVISALTNILNENNYSFAQCALSGKAANNLSLITKAKGSTIHRLLGVGTESQNDEKNPLPYSVIILDEISMVDSKIFLQLLRAIPKDGKLIMLGDSGQLDSIGAGVMNGIIQSKAIPTTHLTKIFRQAQDSAIITHSSFFREGKAPDDLKISAGTSKVYGNNQDFEYIFVKTDDEKDLLLRNAMLKFKEAIEKYGIDGTQIICSTRKTGNVSTATLNQYAQMIANPSDDSKAEIMIDKEYVLREGDKVMNVRNNRLTKSPEGESRPIFNGNTGTLIRIVQGSDDDYLLIDFDGIGEVMVDSKVSKMIELGYAITTHKSQGSTIPCVIFVMPYHFLLNSRELVYTAVTRSSKYQIFLTSPRTLRDALKKTSKRTEQTNISLLIRELNRVQSELGIDIEKEMNKK